MITSTKRLTTAELRQIIDSHEKGHAMIVPINCDYLAAKELLAVRDAKPIGSFHIRDQQVEATTDYVKDGEWPIDNGEILVYAAPPAPAVPDDARRMDWLVAHHVEVRKPLLYGSQKMFTAQTVTDECDDYHATSLREQIDEAMAAAPPPTRAG